MDHVLVVLGLMTMVSTEEPVMLVITLVNVVPEVTIMNVKLVMIICTYTSELVLVIVQMVTTEINLP